ncbi:heparan-alpha-glucosaminide N-acetyltransferase domain-containing protein [Demequina sp. NBRC 110054]|uniref:heparan-alpha-glucosaminide N-acetyltransferase domain-containing protein n=1 Tax=Demequina sp. NBRC 110054 TaxID=1570343 RepID=UPI000A02329E|nr:heparan-alpha-glucosaminide N-acetyltransferase domain-containing protein [Demequina sp. NBRC 110054]
MTEPAADRPVEVGRRSPASSLTQAGRIGGLDLARAIAFMGMVAAHIGDDGQGGSDADGWTWLWIAHGRPSALFAVLAGVSIGIMTARGASLAQTRAKVATRAVGLILVGALVTALGTPVYVILANLGVMMLLVLPALRWRTPWLWGGAVVLLVGGGLALPTIQGWAASSWLGTFPVVDRLWWHHYPALVWAGYLLVGLAISRMDLRARAVRRGLLQGGLGIGVGAAMLGIGFGGTMPWPASGATFGWGPAWASMEAHSYSPVELVSNAGIAMATIALCLWLSDATGRWLAPLRALGAMAFTAYVAHVIVIAVVGDEIVYEPSNVALVVLLATFTAAAWAWRLRFAQGPLESLMTRASNAAATTVAGGPPTT